MRVLRIMNIAKQKKTKLRRFVLNFSFARMHDRIAKFR